ncbi:hypothetical protein M3A96_00955 [Helcobacillus massiliensis]|uniref:hypothetical protein n=1 Tax=Helcobacillus massiliensis TaxID=521392 RepID=UPI0021A57959|nr:hypothetical protein [Helcobacillus massiliensis]MCT1556698.1 hypothetical protein [Helcobacillus massiliensis]MCT2037473.1 hypothetical protein [Helcobacillus massiliensis]MCT2331026.1 hypothetical protein [Helcobacillus massiliensis]
MDSSIVPKLVIPTPPAMAKAMEDGMYAKATKPIGELFWLALTGGAYIALGFIFFVTTQQGSAPRPACRSASRSSSAAWCSPPA